jgi:hypothetical protein
MQKEMRHACMKGRNHLEDLVIDARIFKMESFIFWNITPGSLLSSS